MNKKGKNWRLTPVLVLVAGLATMAAGPRNSDPDWPCQQLKVSELSLGSFWNGPHVDLSADWQHDQNIAALVGAVTQRRMPLDQAIQRINDFALATRSDKTDALLLVFAGVFNVLDHERTEVLDGLDRFGVRQKVLAEGLRHDGEALRAAQSDAGHDDAKLADATQHLLWDQQVFESRRQSLHFACDVPTAIEQRLFGLSKAIARLME